MLHSLRARLIALILLILVVTGGLAAWFASRAITNQFEQYLVRELNASQERRQQLTAMLPQIFANHYIRYGRWDHITELVQQFRLLTEDRLLLTDQTGQVVADSGGTMIGQSIANALDRITPVRVDGQVVGAFIVLSLPSSQKASNHAVFIAQVNRALLLAMLAAGALAIVLTLALTRGILRRVEALTNAVQKMARGDLNQRVANGTDDEIGKLAHAFNAMANSLTRGEELRRNMVSDVAHELRTPLSNIRGYLEAAQDKVVEPSPAFIESLYEEALLLHRLVDDLQELAVAEAGQLKLTHQRVAVGDLVEKALLTVQGRVNGTRIFAIELAPNLPEIQVDAERIGQVLRNLLNNAVEYTPQGKKIVIGARQLDPQEVQINVYNEGDGIVAEHLPAVFERFYRVDHSRNRETGGSGLGLAIVKQLVEAHRGHVWVESVAGAYANFIFTLPVAEPVA